MYPSKWKLEMEERVEKRWFLWHEKNNFTWTNENVQKIFCLNDAIIQKENELYELLANVKNDIETLLSSGKTYYRYYDIDAYLSYEADDYSTPTGDDKTMCDVYCCTTFENCMGFRTSADEPLKTVDEYFMRDTNFNYDYPFRDLPNREHKISRSLYWLIQQDTYTIENLLYLNPKYFVPCIEIRN